MPEVSIVIVNWNSKDYLRTCLQSIKRSVSPPGYEVVVVDSASFDGCGEMLASEYPDVQFIQSDNNIGFALANNLGAGKARGDLLLFLNPDTEVDRHALWELTSAHKAHPDAGIVGPRLLNTDGSLQISGAQVFPTVINQLLDLDFLHRLFPSQRFWRNALAFEGELEPVRVEAVSGACMMLAKENFHAVGGFSSDYFMYAEDIDLCWKVCRFGLSNYYAPRASIVHHGGGSTKKTRSLFSEVMIPESVSRFLRKTQGDAYTAVYRTCLGASALVRIMVLSVILPLGVVLRRASQLHGAIRKWAAILGWSLGQQRWASKYRVLK